MNIAACGGEAPPDTIVDGPQAAMIVGDLKVIVDCWWRQTKLADTAQLFNISAGPPALFTIDDDDDDDDDMDVDNLHRKPPSHSLALGAPGGLCGGRPRS